MFHRFTENARAAVVAAQTAAIELRARSIGADHLLLGVLVTPGVGRRVLLAAGADQGCLTGVVAGGGTAGDDEESLRSLGIDLPEVRRRVEETFGPRALEKPPARRKGFLEKLLPSDHLPFTTAAKRALAGSVELAAELQHTSIGSEHVLVATLRDPAVVAVLRGSGVDLDAATARERVLEELRRSA